MGKDCNCNNCWDEKLENINKRVGDKPSPAEELLKEVDRLKRSNQMFLGIFLAICIVVAVLSLLYQIPWGVEK